MHMHSAGTLHTDPKTASSLLRAGPSLGLGAPEVGADPDVQCTRPPEELLLLVL